MTLKRQKKTILLVEDDIPFSELVRRNLAKLDYTVITVHSGEQAVKTALENPGIDLILMDINLTGGIDGTQAAEIILKEKAIPIVFLSSHTEPEIVAKTENISSYGYVVKDSGFMVLDASIKMAFRLNKAHRDLKSSIIALQQSEERCRSLIQHTNDAIFCYEYDPPIPLDLPVAEQVRRLYYGQLIECNIMAARYYGHRNVEDVKGRKLVDLFNASPGGPVDGLFTAFINNGYQITDGEGVEEMPDGTRRYYLNNAHGVIMNNTLVRVWGVYHDITERKKNMEKLEKLQLILKSSFESPQDIIILSIDKNYQYLFFNNIHKAGMKTAYNRDVELGMNLLDCITTDDDRRKAKNNYDRALAGESHSTIEEFGEINRSYYESFYNPIYNDKKEIIGASAYARNITDRKLAEDRIRHLLEEKELLLKEVHHRVKNNMNTIRSLISLQAKRLSTPEAVSAFDDTEKRIRSMMLLYDKLYQPSKFTKISISEYIPQLVDEIASTFPIGKSVRIVKDLQEISLDSGILIPLGIIINEIITNAMKYAFTGIRSPEIIIRVSLTGNQVTFIFKDNGVGMPGSVNFENPFSFGLLLIKMLTDQIDGSIRLENTGGTGYRLQFNIG